MQATADFHDQITDTRLPQAAGVVNNATAFDAAVDVLNTHAAAGDAPIRGFLGARQGSSSRFAGRHDGFHLVKGERQEAQILEQPAACGQGIRRGIGNPLIMSAPRIGRTQKEDGERRVDQQHIFHRVAFLLAAITARLLSRILGTFDAPFGAIVAKRGEARWLTWGRRLMWSVRPTPSLLLRPLQGASPALSRTGWVHPPACAASPAGPPRGHESTDGLCSGPSRIAAPARLGEGSLQVDQDKQQPILGRGQRAVLVRRVPAGGARLSIEAPLRHMRLECRLEREDQMLKLLDGETGQIEHLCRAGLDVGEP